MIIIHEQRANVCSTLSLPKLLRIKDFPEPTTQMPPRVTLTKLLGIMFVVEIEWNIPRWRVPLMKLRRCFQSSPSVELLGLPDLAFSRVSS